MEWEKGICMWNVIKTLNGLGDQRTRQIVGDLSYGSLFNINMTTGSEEK